MRIGFDAVVMTEGKTAAAHYLSKLIEYLVRANPRLEIYLFSPDKILVDYEPYTHFPQVKRVVEKVPRRERKRWPAKVLPRLLKEYRIDIFHAPVKGSLPYFRPPCRTVITLFDMGPWFIKGGIGSWLQSLRYKMRQLAWSRIADKIITVSETGKADVARFCRVPASNIVVTLLGAGDDADFHFSADEEKQILKKYNLQDRMYVVSVSGLDRSRRNPDFLLEAFAECHRHLPDDIYFVFTGENYRTAGHYQRILRKMDILGIREKVIVTGFVSDKVYQVILRNAMASVVTPFYTGVPLAVMDSFAHGVPVVASACGAIPEIAGEAVLLVDPYDFSAIAGAIRRIIENPVEHSSYAEKSLERAKAFSWERMAEATLKVYEEVLK
jgi:glycosyltransferase involved in cell wall biosynthesis